MSKNIKEFIARALNAPDALSLASAVFSPIEAISLVGGWLNIAYPQR